VLGVLFAGAPSANPLGIPVTEYDALFALKISTNWSSWTYHDNWLTDSLPWYGVTVTAGHATSLPLNDNQLSGTIPPEIGNFTYLQALSLHNNQLSGTIPLQYVLRVQGSARLEGQVSPPMGKQVPRVPDHADAAADSTCHHPGGFDRRPAEFSEQVSTLPVGFKRLSREHGYFSMILQSAILTCQEVHQYEEHHR